MQLFLRRATTMLHKDRFVLDVEVRQVHSYTDSLLRPSSLAIELTPDFSVTILGD